MQEFFYQLSQYIVIILLCLGAFGIGILAIAVITHSIGKILFGQRFEDWWDSKFWF